MGIVQNLATKKELKELFFKGEIVFKEINSTIQPVRNVYYHYEYCSMGIINRSQEISLSEINFSLTTYETYINQLFKIKKDCDIILNKNPKLLSKYFNEYKTLKEYFNIITERISSLIISIYKFDDYKLYAELNIIVNNLQRIKRNMLNQLNLSKIEIMDISISKQKTAQI